MLILVTGGSASGKSALAERYAAALGGPLLYIATMRPFGDGSRERIERHRRQREAYGFDTLEQYTGLEQMKSSKRYRTALLECLGNLAANEMFEGKTPQTVDDTVKQVLAGIGAVTKQVDHLVLVTNDIFGSGQDYEAETLQYMQALGTINVESAAVADTVVEAVCGLPLLLKGEEPS